MQDKSMKITAVTQLTQKKVISQKTERQRTFKIIKIFLVPHNFANNGTAKAWAKCASMELKRHAHLAHAFDGRVDLFCQV